MTSIEILGQLRNDLQTQLASMQRCIQQAKLSAIPVPVEVTAQIERKQRQVLVLDYAIIHLK